MTEPTLKRNCPRCRKPQIGGLMHDDNPGSAVYWHEDGSGDNCEHYLSLPEKFYEQAEAHHRMTEPTGLTLTDEEFIKRLEDEPDDSPEAHCRTYAEHTRLLTLARRALDSAEEIKRLRDALTEVNRMWQNEHGDIGKVAQAALAPKEKEK